MVVDTIHAIYFDALSNPLKQPCLSSFFPPSIPSPSLPSNRCSREKLFRYSLVSRILLLSRIRWTLFSRARKLRRGKREGPRRGSPRIPLSLKYSAFICSRWNSNDSERDEVYPANGVCGGRTSLKRTKLLEFIFALITRKIRGGGGGGDRNFPEGCVRTHSPRSCPRHRTNTTRAPPSRASSISIGQGERKLLLISVSSMCACAATTVFRRGIFFRYFFPHLGKNPREKLRGSSSRPVSFFPTR